MTSPTVNMSTYATRAELSGGSEHALNSAVRMLTHNGFAIASRSSTSATLTGPGPRSTKQNPILGATKVHLSVVEGAFHVDAELGGVDSMRRFLMRFPFWLGLGIGLTFGLMGGFLFGQQFGVGFGVPWATGWRWMLIALCGAMLPVSPWLVLSPVMAGMIRRRTQRAIDVLASNACFASN